MKPCGISEETGCYNAQQDVEEAKKHDDGVQGANEVVERVPAGCYNNLMVENAQEANEIREVRAPTGQCNPSNRTLCQ